jgi:hypothetical protein
MNCLHKKIISGILIGIIVTGMPLMGFSQEDLDPTTGPQLTPINSIGQPYNPATFPSNPTPSSGYQNATFGGPGTPGGGGGDPTGGGFDAGVPFDGGLSILLAIGIGSGLKKQKTKKCK